MRFHITRVFRLVFIVILLVFVLLNVQILIGLVNHDDPYQGRSRTFQYKEVKIPPIDTQYNSSTLNKYMPPSPVRNFTARPIIYANESSISDIRQHMKTVNSEQYIHNLDEFGLYLNRESVVIVVQIHNRVEYLKILLESLRNVRNINKNLLILSHDYYSKELQAAVRTVDFCPMLQMYYPYSMQIHPQDFPGEHPDDCPRNLKKAEALKVKCNNAEYPDTYGHYREASYCQTKHHWFWKLSHSFNNLTILQGYEGLVLLLEEDYYVTADVIHILQLQRRLQQAQFPEFQLLTVGNYDKAQNYEQNAARVETARWISSKHNLGMAITRSLWNAIEKCSVEFCTFDDYNWDWTLQYLSGKCILGGIRVVKMKGTRVFHMGDCGIHHKGKNCDPKEKLNKIKDSILANEQYFFPESLSNAGNVVSKLRVPKPNGGWGDKRDQDLCLSYVGLSDFSISQLILDQ